MRTLLQLGIVAVAGCEVPPPAEPDDVVAAAEIADPRSQVVVDNPSGRARTIHVGGGAVRDDDHPFFQSLGTNDRSCATCHQASENFTVSAAGVQARFEATDGLDPIFRLVDGANSPVADISTVDARRDAYSMLLRKAVIRVGLPIPPDADFELVGVEDPYGFVDSPANTKRELSLFRRPLPTTNLDAVYTFMWDGRESFGKTEAGEPRSPAWGMPLSDTRQIQERDLHLQSNVATIGHAEATGAGLTDEERRAIVAFELQLYTTQVFDEDAGELADLGALGSPEALSGVKATCGANDVFLGDPSGTRFDIFSMRIYDAWQRAPAGTLDDARQSVLRGQTIFNGRTFTIDDVPGVTDDFFAGETLTGTCSVCHDAPGFGNHSVPLMIDIGIADPPDPSTGLTEAGLAVGDLPVYTLREISSGRTVRTTDPGRALVTGRFADVGKMKGPVLRGLAGRLPLFHNGSAASIDDVVSFYDKRFHIGFADGERADLIAFLRTL